jgi:ADP-heptose:LPS heptosyltransferase
MDSSELQHLDQGAHVRRVLIYRLGSLGDTVVAFPCLHLIARTFPDAKRLMLTNTPVHTKAPAAAAIIGESGLVHDYISYPTGLRNAIVFFQLWRKIRQFAPDILIYLAAPRGEKAVRRDLSFFRLCGIQQIIGAPVGELAEPRYDAQTDMWEHEASRLARTLSSLGHADPRNIANWDLRLTPVEQDAADRALVSLKGKRLIAAGIGTKMQAKDWGVEKWGALIDRLSDKFPDHALVLIGAHDESVDNEKAGSKWRGKKLNLCGNLSPRETAAVIRHAELFIGPDSGLMHFAAASGVPCAIAFSARGKPGRWYPFGDGHQIVYHKTDCFGCGLETCIEQRKKCLESIQVDEMFYAVIQAWKHGRARRAVQFV